jgi:hypothetical protein
MGSVDRDGEARSDGQFPHSFREEDLPRAGQVTDPLGNGDRQAGYVSASDLNFSAVDSDPHIQGQRRGCLSDLQGASYSSCTAVEGGQEAIANCFDLSPSVLMECSADYSVVLVKEISPASGAEPGRLLSGRDDVGEQDGRQDHFSLCRLVAAGEEIFDLVDEAVGVAHEEKMIITRQHHQLGVGNVLSKVTPRIRSNVVIPLAVDHERRHLD